MCFVNKGKLSIFKMSRKVQNLFCHIYFLNLNISVNIKTKYLKFSLVILGIYKLGTVYPNCNIGFSSHFMKCRINVKKKIYKSFPFFIIK